VFGIGCIVPQPFAAGVNRPYLESWVVIGGPWFLGYKTPTVAPEPFVERAVKIVLAERLNRYSYATMSAIAGFGSEATTQNPMVVPTV
jgi:hypothetical protein